MKNEMKMILKKKSSLTFTTSLDERTLRRRQSFRNRVMMPKLKLIDFTASFLPETSFLCSLLPAGKKMAGCRTSTKGRRNTVQ